MIDKTLQELAEMFEVQPPTSVPIKFKVDGVTPINERYPGAFSAGGMATPYEQSPIDRKSVV